MPTISALGIGSGLDLNGLLDQLESAEREKLAPIVRSQNSFEARISAFGQLRSSLAQFQTAVAKLNKADLFESVQSDVTGESLLAAAGTGAVTGTYNVNVAQLARAYSVATVGIADRDANLGAGTVSINLADGNTLSVPLESDSSSLENIRDAINALEAGVSASIINDGSETPYRLALTSTTEGTEAAVAAIDFGELASSLSLDPVTEVTALDANFSVNGVEISSQTNLVEGAVEGLSLTLIAEGESTLRVSTDTEIIEKAVTDFVSAYNNLQEKITSLTGYDQESGTAGELHGNSTLRSVQTRLRNVFIEGVPAGDLRALTDIGITLQLDGTLEVDNDVLGDVVTEDLSALADFLAADSREEGLAGKLDQALETILRDGGLIAVATDGLEGRVDRLEDRYARVETSISRTVERYRRQFAELDNMVARMNSTSNYVAQQFNILNAQLNQNN